MPILKQERTASNSFNHVLVCAGDRLMQQDFRDRVDLRQNDSFGRNALYYSCLCGHMDAVHLLTSHVYGGIKVRCRPSSFRRHDERGQIFASQGLEKARLGVFPCRVCWEGGRL